MYPKKKTFENIHLNFLISNEYFTEIINKDFVVSLVEYEGTIQFETRIPDYLYEEAKKQYPDLYDQDYITEKANKEIKSFGCAQDFKNKAKSKVIRSATLNGIKGEIHDLSLKLNIIHTFEGTHGEKMIFINFSGQTGQARDANFGANMGLVNSIRFQYFVGYKFDGMGKKHLSDEMIHIEKYSANYKCGISDGEHNKYREESIVPLHSTDKEREKLKDSYLIIPWSEEREQYLKDIQTSFTIMTNKLNEFLKDLTQIKLDHLIDNHPVRKFLTS